MQSLELLAPAKNLECGIAAIDHGADAVYIGAQKFGARVAAGNSVDDIRALCRYAHQYGAKVYVTVNTIIYDNELKDTERLILELQEAGVDAILIQDMGLLQLSILNSQFSTIGGPVFLEVKVKKGNRKDLGRPTTTPIQNKEALMDFLKK